MGQSLVNADVGNIVNAYVSDSLNLAGATITSSLISAPTATYDLGSSSNYWNNLYITGTSHGGAGVFSSLKDTSLTGPADLYLDGTSIIQATGTPLNGQILIGTGLTPVLGNITGTAGALLLQKYFLKN